MDFVTWAVQKYPAKKYALVLSDHGGGWTGGFSDMTTSLYSDLSMPEIVTSIEQIRQNTGIDKFEMIGFDACLMGQIEIFGSLYPYSNYMVASEEVIPGYGWSYAAWLDQVAQTPPWMGADSPAPLLNLCVDDILLTEELRASAGKLPRKSLRPRQRHRERRVPDCDRRDERVYRCRASSIRAWWRKRAPIRVVTFAIWRGGVSILLLISENFLKCWQA